MLPEAGPAGVLAWGGSCGRAQGWQEAPSGVAEAWRNPGGGCSWVLEAQAGLGEASGLIPFSLLEMQPPGSSYQSCLDGLTVV